MQNIKLNISNFYFISRKLNVKKKKIRIFFSLFLKNISAFFEVLIFLIISYIFTQNLPEGKIFEIIKIDSLIYFLPALIIIRLAINYLDLYNQETLINSINANLKKNAVSRLFKKENLNFSYINYKISGESNSITNLFKLLISLIGIIIQVGVFFASILYLNKFIFLTIFLLILIFSFPSKKIISKIKKNTEESKDYGIELDNVMERILYNYFLIKFLRFEDKEVNRFQKFIDVLNIKKIENIKYNFVSHNIFTFLVTLSISVLLIQNKLDLNLNLEITFLLIRSIQLFSQSITMYSQIVAQSVFVKTFIDDLSNDVINESRNEVNVHKKNSELMIELENITFSYDNENKNIFEDLNFEICENEHVLIIGPNGSGKSTFIGLAAGIYTPKKGTTNLYTSNFSYVGPLPLIFFDTLKNNILYGNENLNLDDAALYNLIEKLNVFQKKYSLEDSISSRTLSSGQMQKIALIRAILKNPDVLFLDEATSNLDKNSIAIVNDMLLNSGKTVINVTHKPELFSYANKIYKVENKKLIKSN